MRARFARAAIVAALLVTFLQGCAYYNTFYLARRYYARSLNDVPYPLDKTDISNQPQFTRSIDLSKKLIENYPKSKWVDDAYVLWAKSLVGNDDPREAIRMLEEFPGKFPKSSSENEATFYLGVAYLRARKYERGLEALDKFLDGSSRKGLEPYANLERSRALLALERPAEAADAAGKVVKKESGSLQTRARVARAEALIEQGSYDKAREDFRTLGSRALNDEDRLNYLLREVDCLEGARKYDEALALLRNAIGHEREPLQADTTGGKVAVGPSTPEAQHFGRLLLRIGTVQLRAGTLDQALASYRRVIADYPRTNLAGEAQYRIGYAYETVGDDFDRAREEYGRVRESAPGSSFAEQATVRLSSLERLAQYRTATGDSVQQAAEGQFLLAEQYLFELDRPDRAIEEYQKIAQNFSGTHYEAKALTAQGWVLGRKLNRKSSADSVFWIVVREHAGTEAQLAARDYLEADGIEVPVNLIRLPTPILTHADSVAADSVAAADLALAAADSARAVADSVRAASGDTTRTDSLGAVVDSLGALTQPPAGPNLLGAPPPTLGTTPGAETQLGQPPTGTIGLAPIVVPPDSTRAAQDSLWAAPPDTTQHTAPPDTSRTNPPPPPPPDTSRTTPR